jgi:hypothetical protein
LSNGLNALAEQKEKEKEKEMIKRRLTGEKDITSCQFEWLKVIAFCRLICAWTAVNQNSCLM